MIHIENITDGMEKEIDRLIDGPTITDYLEFETVLIGQFLETQAGVHVITSSLKSSGKIDSSFTNSKWEGEITYGGASTGIHNPVKYAEYEREREGPHDFLAPASAHDHGYVSAIASFLRG